MASKGEAERGEGKVVQMGISLPKIRRQLVEMRATISRQTDEIQQKDDEIARLANRLQEMTETMFYYEGRYNETLTISQRQREEMRSAKNREKFMGRRIARLESEGSEYRLTIIEQKEEIARLEKNAEIFRSRWHGEIKRIAVLRDQLLKISKWGNRQAEKVGELESRLRQMGRWLDNRNEELFGANVRMEKLEADNREMAKELQMYEAAANDAAFVDPPIIEIFNLPNFESRNDFAGFAPCGNGCHVKRDGNGRLYDSHEITCEESEDFTGDFDRFRN